MLPDWIKEFEKEMEMEGMMIRDEQGIYTLPLEEDLEIKISPLGEGFLLNSDLGPFPKNTTESFYMQALMGNLLGQGTRNAVLGISRNENRLTLSQALEYTVDYKEFKEFIEDFINTVDYWRSVASVKQ